MANQILEGTWSDVSRMAAGLRAESHVRLEVIEDKKPSKKIQKGMFPGLKNITDEDFKAAEGHLSEKDLH